MGGRWYLSRRKKPTAANGHHSKGDQRPNIPCRLFFVGWVAGCMVSTCADRGMCGVKKVSVVKNQSAPGWNLGTEECDFSIGADRWRSAQVVFTKCAAGNIVWMKTICADCSFLAKIHPAGDCLPVKDLGETCSERVKIRTLQIDGGLHRM